MSLTLIEKTTAPTARGLDALVRQLETAGFFSLGLNWADWFGAAAEQLETDDSLDAHLTDELAEQLAEAEEAIRGGWNAAPALGQLVSLYHRAQAARPLEQVWREKAAGLGLVQLETRTWEDLHKALDAAAAGRHALVARWIDGTEEAFLATWEGYESSDVLEEEITAETVLGHHLLREGVESWLEALAAFRDTLESGVDRAGVLALAEAGQRLLLVVQIAEAEAKDSASRFIAAWSN